MLKPAKHHPAATLAFAALVGGMALTAACVSEYSAAPPRMGQADAPYQVGHIIESRTRAVVPYAALGARLRAVDVVYIGETHYTPSHVAAALRVLRTILDGGRRPTLGMEMFSWDGQDGLDRYLNGTVTSVETFLTESRWRDNWGGDYQDYSPLVAFAKTHGLTLLGMNPPRARVRQVARHGLDNATGDATDDETGAATREQRWAMPDPFPPDDHEYRRVVYAQIEQCHAGLSPDVYRTIYEASVFRDEGMAAVIAATAATNGGESRPVVSYTGAGHMQYGLPVPKRVRRRLGDAATSVTVYLHALSPDHPEDVDRLLEEPIADYVWLTALGPQGRQPRCGT